MYINNKLLNIGLKPTLLHMFLKMVEVSEDNEVTGYSLKAIGEVIGCKGTNRVNEYIKALAEKELIIINSGNGTTNTYILNSDYFVK